MFLPMLLVFAATDVPDVVSVTDAAIDAFVALIPPAKPDPRAQMLLERLDQNTLAELKKLNPGRDKEVGEATARSAACQRRAFDEIRIQTLRASARPLSDEKLRRLATFYTGPDFAIFERLAHRAPDKLSPAEKNELVRLTSAYPLEEFSKNYQKNAPESWEPTGVLAAIGKCNIEMDADLLKGGLTPRSVE